MQLAHVLVLSFSKNDGVRSIAYENCSLQQAGLDKAQQCAHLRACLECWTQLPGEVDDTAMRQLEEYVETQIFLRYRGRLLLIAVECCLLH